LDHHTPDLPAILLAGLYKCLPFCSLGCKSAAAQFLPNNPSFSATAGATAGAACLTPDLPVYLALLCAQVCLPLAHQLLWVRLLEHLPAAAYVFEPQDRGMLWKRTREAVRSSEKQLVVVPAT
jgi:hypothetical protein